MMSGCLGQQCSSSGYVKKCTQLRCLPISVSVVRCPFAFLVNFSFTSGKKYGQIKVIKCPNSSPHGDVSGLKNHFQALGYGALIHLFVFLPPYPPHFSSYFISVTGALFSSLLCGGSWLRICQAWEQSLSRSWLPIIVEALGYPQAPNFHIGTHLLS